MKKTILFLSLLLIFSESIALAVIYTGAMDNRTGLPFVPGFTGHSQAWITGGDDAGGLRLEWQADNESTPGLWTFTYRLLRNTARNKGFAFFDIETAGDFTTANLKARQVLSATDRSGAPIPSGLASVTISGFQNFTSGHDFSNAAVSEVNPLTALSKLDLSHYSGDPGRVAPGQPGGSFSAKPSAGPEPHPFTGIRVTFPGSFATLVNMGYEACAWEFRVVTDRVPMWGHIFGWGDQTTLSPFWYSDIYNNHIDDPARLTLAPINSLTGADPYQGWVLVPGPLPSVLSTLPSDTSTTVPVSEPVTAVFSGMMNPATINATTFTLTDGSGPIAGSVSYDPSANAATFTPDAPLLPNNTYTATITSGATDLAGNALNTAKIWNFTSTDQDSTPPAVTATLPGNNATFVAVTTPITATFDEELKPDTITPSTFTLTSVAGAVTGKVVFNPSIRTATFTPDAPLSNNTLYTATITNGVTDLADNAITAPFSWNLTTIPQETVLPMIDATIPANLAGNITINTPITATFSEPMDSATINGANFKVSSAGVPVAGTVNYDTASNTATFVPVAPLAFSTTYSASITTAVSDPAGNHLPLDKVWSFTTAVPDNIPPKFTGTSPAAGSTNIPITVIISANFSEQIDPTTIGPASVTMTGQSFTTSSPFAVTGTVSLSRSGFTLPRIIFTPGTPLPLPMGSVYTVTVTGVKDLAGNTMIDKTWSFTTTPDGILIPGEATATIADALRVLSIAVNLIPKTLDDSNHGDVAPLGLNGKPQPDGVIDIMDALIILRKVVGLVTW